MSAQARRNAKFKAHWVEHKIGAENLVRIYPGMNLFIGPSTTGKGHLCKKMIEISMRDNLGRDFFCSVVVVSMNAASSCRWKLWFKDTFNVDVVSITVPQLPTAYFNLCKRYAEFLQKRDPRTGKLFTYGPNTLLIIDDFSGDSDPKVVKKTYGLLKNMPCVRSAAFDGRNSGIYTCMLAQVITMIPCDAFDQCKFIACGNVKSYQAFDKHVFPKILCQSMKKFPHLGDWSEGEQRQWWKKQFATLQEHEFLVRFEYRDKGKLTEEIEFYTAPP